MTYLRGFVGDKLIAWHNLVAKIVPYQLSYGRDIFTWDIHSYGYFIVRSTYQYLINQGSPFTNKFIWKPKDSPYSYWVDPTEVNNSYAWKLVNMHKKKRKIIDFYGGLLHLCGIFGVLITTCKALEVIALDTFSKNGWKRNNRLFF
ncbi:hypothetical protein SETIT_4G140400v2 [Setaria italica]|uniref:Uncharacterized protein n=1 Tax=Setaria italica TaxID=4555 RepID=A0A368QU07_SETIT|nr:hypothetical protein SETIT_4G140400v2 [Setaria italica]